MDIRSESVILNEKDSRSDEKPGEEEASASASASVASASASASAAVAVAVALASPEKKRRKKGKTKSIDNPPKVCSTNKPLEVVAPPVPQVNAENPQLCFKKIEVTGDESNVVIASKPLLKGEREAEPSEAPCSEPVSGGPSNMFSGRKRKRKPRNNKKKATNPVDLLHLQNAINHAQNRTQADPPIPICPKPASQLDQASSVDPARPIYPEPAPLIGQNILAASAIQHEDEPNVAIAQHSGVYPKPSLDTAVPTDPEKKNEAESSEAPAEQAQPQPTSEPVSELMVKWMKKRKQRSVAKRTKKMLGAGTQPNEHNIKQPETQVQTLIHHTVAPPVHPTIPMDPHPAIPIRPAMGTEPVTVTKAPTRRQSERLRSQICWACQRTDHRIRQCQLVKTLSKNDEICFFCSRIGHSLGKCSLSLAGGGRFSKCLICHAQGHFSYDCPGDGHGNYEKVVAANWPINKTKA